MNKEILSKATHKGQEQSEAKEEEAGDDEESDDANEKKPLLKGDPEEREQNDASNSGKTKDLSLKKED